MVKFPTDSIIAALDNYQEYFSQNHFSYTDDERNAIMSLLNDPTLLAMRQKYATEKNPIMIEAIYRLLKQWLRTRLNIQQAAQKFIQDLAKSTRRSIIQPY